MKIYILLIFSLCFISCNDDQKNRLSYPLPKTPERFNIVYFSGNSLEEIQIKNDIFILPEPLQWAMNKKENYWVNGYLKALYDGEFAIRGNISYTHNEPSVGVYIDEEYKHPIVLKNTEIKNHVFLSFFYEDKIYVKKGDILTLRVNKDKKNPPDQIFNLTIYFEPKYDKRSGEDTVGPVSAPSGGLGSQGVTN